MQWKRAWAIAVLIWSFAIVACRKTEVTGNSINSGSKSPDVTMSIRIGSSDSIQVYTYRMKDDRARTDTEDGEYSSIHDPKVGTIYLNHRKKHYRIAPLANPETGDIEPKTAKYLSQALKLKFTGREMHIGKWNCQEFLIWDSMDLQLPKALRMKSVAWIATDFEIGKQIQNRHEKLSPYELHKIVKTISGKDFALPGFAFKFENSGAGESSTTTTCESISFDLLKEELFEVPANYSETK